MIQLYCMTTYTPDDGVTNVYSLHIFFQFKKAYLVMMGISNQETVGHRNLVHEYLQ